MWRHDPRTLVLRALLLDWLGQLLIFTGISISSRWIVPMAGLPLFESQGLWLIFCLLLYPLLGWLFGSFTVLSWRRLAFPVLLQRLLITAMVTFVVVAISRWLVNPSEELWLVFPQAQVLWLGALTIWSLLIRIALRRGLLSPDAPRLLLLASDEEIAGVLHAWARVASCQRLEPISPQALEQLLKNGAEPLLVALSPRCRRDSSLSGLIKRLEIHDPRFVQTISIATEQSVLRSFLESVSPSRCDRVQHESKR